MKCPKCNSENVQVQSKEYKPKLTIPILGVFVGFGLMFLGIIGAVGGVLIGLIVSAIVKGVLPQTYQGVMVCQNCGYTGAVDERHKNSSDLEDDNFNLIIARESSKIGNAVLLRVQVDNRPFVEIANGGVAKYSLSEGTHVISYSQKSGIGKADRFGTMNVQIDTAGRLEVRMMFLPKGINVTSERIGV